MASLSAATVLVTVLKYGRGEKANVGRDEKCGFAPLCRLKNTSRSFLLVIVMQSV